MHIPELKTKLLSYFDLNREEYHICHSYLRIDMERWTSIAEAAERARTNLDSSLLTLTMWQVCNSALRI